MNDGHGLVASIAGLGIAALGGWWLVTRAMPAEIALAGILAGVALWGIGSKGGGQ